MATNKLYIALLFAFMLDPTKLKHKLSENKTATVLLAKCIVPNTGLLTTYYYY